MKKTYLFLLALMMAVMTPSVLRAQQSVLQEGFESTAAGNIPTGWTQSPVDASKKWAVEIDDGNNLFDPAAAASGVGRIKLVANTNPNPLSGNEALLITPAMNITTLAEPILIFDHAAIMHAGSVVDTLKVYYRLANNRPWILAASYGEADNWVRDTVSFPSKTSSFQIAFGGLDNGARGVVLDNIRMTSRPICQEVSNVEVYNKIHNEAKMRWAGSLSSTYNVKISTQELLDPATATEADGLYISEVVEYKTNLELNASKNKALASSTTYYYYIQSDCGFGDVSDWVSGSFTTACDPVESFATSFDAPEDMNCWTAIGENYGTWKATPPTNVSTGVYQGLSTDGEEIWYSFWSPEPHSGASALWMNVAGRGDDYTRVYAVSPRLADNVDLKDMQLSFWMKSNSKKIHLRVIVSDWPDDFSNAQDAGEIRVRTEMVYEPFTLTFEDITSTGKYIAFMIDGSEEYIGNQPQAPAVNIDDVVLETLQPCSSETKVIMFSDPEVTGSTAKLAWNRSGAAKWNVKVSTSSINPGTDPGVIYDDVVETPELTLSGLSSATRYFYYVQPICADEVVGTWSNAQSFDTECIADGVELPFRENFDKYEVGAAGQGNLPPCWSYKVPAGTTNYLPYLTNSNYANSLYNYISFYTDGVSYVVTPKINANLKDCQVRFAYSIGALQMTLEVGIMEDPNDDATFKKMAEFTMPEAGSYNDYKWQDAIVRFEEYSGAGQYVAFRFPTAGIQYRIDDVVVEDKSSCGEPTDFVMQSASTNAIILNWTPSENNETEWNIAYGKAGAVLGMNTTEVTGITTVPYELTGLEENTVYDIYLRSVCGEDALGRWVGPIQAKTNSPATVPYFCDFEDASMAGAWNLENGIQDNQWIVGNAVAAENNNTGKALYISNDYGMSNVASPKETYDYACRLMELEAGLYDFEFDWRLQGQVQAPYIKEVIFACLVPADIELVGGTVPNYLKQICSEIETNYYDMGVRWDYHEKTPGWIYLTDRDPLGALDNQWRHYKAQHQLRKSGRYNLVFFFGKNSAQNVAELSAAIDNVSVKRNTEDCLRPEDVRAFDITQNSAKIEFLCYNADQWEVKLSTDTLKTIDEINAAQMGDEGMVYVANQNTNPLVLTGLSPETRYFAYFRPTCGTDQDWAEVEFRTICEAYDVPLEYTFDDLEENSFLTCWRSIPETFNMGWDGPAAPAIYVGKFSPYDDINQTNLTNMLIFASTYSGEGVYASTPELIPDVKALQASFRLVSKVDMAQYPLELQVGVMSDPLDESTFELIETIQPRYAGQWKTYNVYFDGYEGTARHIAFRMPSVSGYSGTLYVDDLKIDSISGCVPPREITVENVTDNSADISWRVVGEVGTYHVKVTTEPLGRWEDEANIYDDKVVGDNQVQLTGLRSAKMYYVYVRTDCGDATYSDGMSEANFRTGCGLTEVLPYYEDFESYDLNDVPACWTLVQNPSGYGTRLISMNYTTILGETVKSLGKLSLSINSDRLMPGMIALPAMETENISELSIMFKGLQGFSADHLVVGIISDLTNPETFVPIDTINLSVMDQWFDCTVDFASYTGTGKNIAFFVASSYFGSTFTVDNIMIRKTAVTCPDATIPQVLNVTSTGAIVRWADNPSVSAFELKVASDEINPEIDRGDVMDGESFGTLSAVLENLEPAKEYYVYLRNVCDDESAGYWSEGVSFRTQCADPETIPYDEDFTGYGEIADQGFFPACWRSRLITYGSISPADQPEPYIENSTRPSLFMKAVYDEKDNSYAVVDAATPVVDFGEANAAGYYMELAIKSSAKEGKIYVGMMSDPSDASTFVAYDTLSVNTENEWENHIVNFLYHEGTEQHIAFRINSLDAKKTYQVNITDIHVDVLPDCMPPFRVRADIRPNKAFITWMPGDVNNNEWKYYYSDNSSKMTIPFTDEEWETANPWGEINVSAVTSERKLTINGLKDWTNYYFYIKTTACDKFYPQPIDLSSRPTCDKMTEEDLPYVADFTINGFGTEDPFYSAFFDCWKREDGYVTDPVSYPYIAEDSTLYYKSLADTLNFAYLPGVATGADTVIAKTQLRFTAKALTENAQALVGVGIYYTEGWPAQDFFEYFPFDTITLTQDWQEYVVKFEGFEWENDWSKSYKDIRVALGVGAGSEYKVNALTWEEIPYCYTPEMTLKSHDKTSFSVEWEKLDDQERWEVVYGEAGLVPEEGNIIVRTDTTYTVVNLEEGTPYEFYLRSNCGNGMNSEWGRLSVTTEQTPATYPYTSNDLSDGTVIAGDTLYYAYRTVDMPAGPHKLGFDWKLADDANAWLRVFVVPDTVMFTGDSDFGLTKTEQPESWTAVATLAGETSWKSTTQDMYVAKANEGPVHILFVWTKSGSDVTEVVRNISMSASTECTVPEALSATQVTSTSAVLDWVSYNADAWDLNYYETSNPGSMQTLMDVEPGYLLDGLNPDTEYTFEVTSQCKPGIYSEPYTFRTACAPVDELYETFDAGSFDNCWKQYHGLIDEVDADPSKLVLVDQGWDISTKAILGTTGTPHARLTVAGDDCANWLVSPAVKLTENSALSFNLALTAYNGDGPIASSTGQADDKFMVVISADEGKTWKKADATIWNNEKDQNKTFNRISNVSQRIEVDLSTYTGKTIRVGFYGESTVAVESNDIHIDSVRIDCRINKVLNKETCQGYSYYANGFEIPKEETDVPGLFEFTRVEPSTTGGCDTTYILNLTIKPGEVTEYDRQTCSNELYSDENFSFTTLEEMKTGTYTRTYPASNGCDSLVIMNLVVNPAYEYDRNLTISEDDLPYTYECQLFPVGTQSGMFEIACTTTESCDSIIHLNLTVLPGTGIDEVSAGGALVLTPNPVERGKVVTAEYDFTVAEQRDLRVEVYNNLGMLISVSNPVGLPIALNAPEVSGVYTVRIVTGTKDTYIGKFIVK